MEAELSNRVLGFPDARPNEAALFPRLLAPDPAPAQGSLRPGLPRARPGPEKQGHPTAGSGSRVWLALYL